MLCTGLWFAGWLPNAWLSLHIRGRYTEGCFLILFLLWQKRRNKCVLQPLGFNAVRSWHYRQKVFKVSGGVMKSLWHLHTVDWCSYSFLGWKGNSFFSRAIGHLTDKWHVEEYRTSFQFLVCARSFTYIWNNLCIWPVRYNSGWNSWSIAPGLSTSCWPAVIFPSLCIPWWPLAQSSWLRVCLGAILMCPHWRSLNLV